MANLKSTYHLYSHTTPNIQTLGEFVSDSDSIGVGLNIVELLSYQDEKGDYNLDHLIKLYSKQELQDFNSLLERIRNKFPTTINTTTSTVNSSNTSVNITSSNQNIQPIISIKRPVELNTLLRTGDLSYLSHSISTSNQLKLKQLYSQDTQYLFQKFIYRVESETDYTVEINNTIRSATEQKRQIAKGSSASNFSYHMSGMALDTVFRSKTNPTIILNKNSSASEWMKSGIVKIADDMKLLWGGRFKNVPFDPVHFDASYYYSVDKQKFLTSLSDNPLVEEEVTDENSTYADLPIKLGTSLAIALSKVDRDVLATETNQTINSVDYESFLAKRLVELLSDKGYMRSFVPKTKAFNGTVKEIYPYISVWIWSRALSIANVKVGAGEETSYEHRIINVTPYVQSLDINVTENGGDFSISLAPLTGQLGSKGDARRNANLGLGWRVEEGTHKASPGVDKDYVSENFTHYFDNDEFKRNRLYFEKALQANDIVFIRYERLELEEGRQNLDELDTISISDLPNQIFDMIGLIDKPTVTTQHSTAQVNVSIVGRDLVKLIIEDGVYFYPTEATSDGIFANTGATNSRLKRFGSNGEYLSRFQKANKTIDRSLKFIINCLGSIEICPSNLFDGYGSVPLDRTSSKIVDQRSRAFPLIDIQADLNIDQQQQNDEKKEKILDRITVLRKTNQITTYSSIEVYNLIKTFLKERIQNKEIVIEGGKIKSWTTIEEGRLIKNKIPTQLHGAIVTSERMWIDQKNRKLTSNLISTNVTSQLDTLYKKVDKAKLNAEASLVLFKTLSKLESFTRSRNNINIITKINVTDIVNELTTYISQGEKSPYDDIPSQIIFDIVDILRIDQATETSKLKGEVLSLAVIAKSITDLSGDEKQIFDDIYEIIINESSITTIPSTPETPPLLAGIWQIIKLVIDDSVKDRRLTDASIGNENGSMINAIRKICQDPFCEFYTDTYGSQFYFIARKKPFDQESIVSMLEGRAIYEKVDPIDDSQSLEADKIGSLPPNVNSLTVRQQSLIIDIEEEDVISDMLTTSTEAYSWYKLQLANLTTGSSSDMAFAYLKAIYFDEYADIFGNKPLDLTTSYIPYSPILDKNKKLPTAYFIRQGVYDLKYMIESHAYLPFTRQGTITINGDRRIKRGTFVRLKGTGEIGYVDVVSNSYAIGSDITRTTTLQVSRLMVERFIKGVDYNTTTKTSAQFTGTDPLSGLDNPTNANVNPNNQTTGKVNISYFNLCHLPIDEAIFTNSELGYSDFSKASTAQWKVNKTVFNFFLKKLQFAKNDREIFDSGLNLFDTK